jgi:hypothetical protein
LKEGPELITEKKTQELIKSRSCAYFGKERQELITKMRPCAHFGKEPQGTIESNSELISNPGPGSTSNDHRGAKTKTAPSAPWRPVKATPTPHPFPEINLAAVVGVAIAPPH